MFELNVFAWKGYLCFNQEKKKDLWFQDMTILSWHDVWSWHQPGKVSINIPLWHEFVFLGKKYFTPLFGRLGIADNISIIYFDIGLLSQGNNVLQGY